MAHEEDLDHLLDFLPEPTPTSQLTGESLRASEEAWAALLGPGLAPSAPPPKTSKPTPQRPPKGERPGLDRAYDLIRSGVSAEDLLLHERLAGSAEDLRRYAWVANIFGRLVSTAMSFLQAGLTCDDWMEALADPDSKLGRQARLNSRMREYTDDRYAEQLEIAWGQAEAHVAEDPAFTAEEVTARARALHDAVQEEVWTTARFPGATPLMVSRGRVVYLHCIERAEHYGHTSPYLPQGRVEEDTGLDHAERVLEWLCKVGLLRCVERGKRWTKATARLAQLEKPLPRGQANRYCVLALTSLEWGTSQLPPNRYLVPHSRGNKDTKKKGATEGKAP